jgi:hypothetical protein
MDDSYTITECSSPDFAPLLDQLIARAKFNPIYSSKFNSYYEEIFNKKSKNLSLIISKNQNPILCILCSVKVNSVDESEFEYLGRPAALISNPDIDMKGLSEATQTLIRYIASNRSNPFSSSAGEVFGSLRINGSAIFNISYFQKLISKFSQAQTKFGRVIDLEQNLELVNDNYSKSVKSAIRVKLDASDKVEIIHNQSSKESISSAFESLKTLHFNSAGRRTRSEASWDIQELFLSKGDAFISHFRRDDEIISSAYFMQTKFDAYYGVSASIPKTKGISMSHLCIFEAIKYCKENNVYSMHLGDQYSYLSSEISEKEKNIEKFKSFFGGDLVLEILFTK